MSAFSPIDTQKPSGVLGGMLGYQEATAGIANTQSATGLNNANTNLTNVRTNTAQAELDTFMADAEVRKENRRNALLTKKLENELAANKLKLADKAVQAQTAEIDTDLAIKKAAAENVGDTISNFKQGQNVAAMQERASVLSGTLPIIVDSLSGANPQQAYQQGLKQIRALFGSDEAFNTAMQNNGITPTFQGEASINAMRNFSSKQMHLAKGNANVATEEHLIGVKEELTARWRAVTTDKETFNTEDGKLLQEVEKAFAHISDLHSKKIANPEAAPMLDALMGQWGTLADSALGQLEANRVSRSEDIADALYKNPEPYMSSMTDAKDVKYEGSTAGVVAEQKRKHKDSYLKAINEVHYLNPVTNTWGKSKLAAYINTYYKVAEDPDDDEVFTVQRRNPTELGAALQQEYNTRVVNNMLQEAVEISRSFLNDRPARDAVMKKWLAEKTGENKEIAIGIANTVNEMNNFWSNIAVDETLSEPTTLPFSMPGGNRMGIR